MFKLRCEPGNAGRCMAKGKHGKPLVPPWPSHGVQARQVAHEAEAEAQEDGHGDGPGRHGAQTLSKP